MLCKSPSLRPDGWIGLVGQSCCGCCSYYYYHYCYRWHCCERLWQSQNHREDHSEPRPWLFVAWTPCLLWCWVGTFKWKDEAVETSWLPPNYLYVTYHEWDSWLHKRGKTNPVPDPLPRAAQEMASVEHWEQSVAQARFFRRGHPWS